MLFNIDSNKIDWIPYYAESGYALDSRDPNI